MEIKFSPQSDDDNYNNTTTDYQEPSDTFNSVVVDDQNNGGFSDNSYQDPYSAPQQDRYSGQYVPNQQNFNTSGQTNPQYNQPYGNSQYGNQQYQPACRPPSARLCGRSTSQGCRRDAP